MILPTAIHGLRRRLSIEFERRNLAPNVIAEIDSLSLLLSCVQNGMGATIKPMSAALEGGKLRPGWRVLPISDAMVPRQNFLYTVPPDKLSPAASAVKTELKDVVQHLATSGRWKGVKLLAS
jgi:LysR family tcuABC transcriptional regulator